MPVYRVPDMDSVTTKTELMNYFKAWRTFWRALTRDVATDAGMLRAMLKGQDERQGTKAAAACVRPLVWVAASATYAIMRAYSLTAQRVHNNFGPQVKPKPRRGQIDWDK